MPVSYDRWSKLELSDDEDDGTAVVSTVWCGYSLALSLSHSFALQGASGNERSMMNPAVLAKDSSRAAALEFDMDFAAHQVVLLFD
jgi:hypothetical protein